MGNIRLIFNYKI